MPAKAFKRTAMSLVLGITFALGWGSAAFAHVEIEADTPLQGALTTLRISVPNEKADASTVSIDLRFPAEGPLTEIAVIDTAGWVSTLSSQGIVWTGGPLSGDARVEFSFQARLPVGPTSLVFKALQTYDNAEVVRWIQTATDAQGDEPAPTLKLEGVAPETVVQQTTASGITTDSVSQSPTESVASGAPPTLTTQASASALDISATTLPSTAKEDDSGASGSFPIFPTIVAVAALVLIGLALIKRKS